MLSSIRTHESKIQKGDTQISGIQVNDTERFSKTDFGIHKVMSKDAEMQINECQSIAI